MSLAVGPSGEIGFAGYIDQPVDFGAGLVTPPGAAHQASFVVGVLAPP